MSGEGEIGREMVNFAVQRKNMVEGQVRPSDVVDRRILRAMLEIPREKFVPEDVRSLAYMDREVRMSPRVNGARCLMAPRVHARLIQALELEHDAIVLEVGCGTGYGSAVMAKIVQTVVGLESDPVLAATATETLSALGIDNAVVVVGSLKEGWPSEGPYDAILLSGAVPEVPETLFNQLKDGGRLVAVIADGGVGRATVWQRSGSNVSPRTLFDAAAPVLPGFERAPEFVF